MNCDIPVNLIQSECKEIPNLINSVRVYRRYPRKLKKKIKKRMIWRVSEDSLGHTFTLSLVRS